MASTRTEAPERVTVELALPVDATLGDRFRIARVAARLRPSDAARRLGISLSLYQRIEAGTRPPRHAERVAFAVITGQDAEFFEAAAPVAA